MSQADALTSQGRYSGVGAKVIDTNVYALGISGSLER